MCRATRRIQASIPVGRYLENPKPIIDGPELAPTKRLIEFLKMKGNSANEFAVLALPHPNH